MAVESGRTWCEAQTPAVRVSFLGGSGRAAMLNRDIIKLNIVELKTRSTIEVAHFSCFFSERRWSLIPNRRNVNLDFDFSFFVDLGHGIFRRQAF